MCGIFGFAGKLGNHEFNILKFSILGAINDSRGGDSAGALIDGKCEWGIGDEKLFANFATKNKFLKGYRGVSVQHALGHCRKASVGAKTIKEAQPVCIPNDEDSKIDFAMIHNGTLLNHSELKNKYLAKVPDHFTDSQIFANVVYYHGFKVLEEYDGAGAFAFVDYRKKIPTFYLFKGESPQYRSSVTSSEERPLFWVKTPEGIWFSSIKESLELITYGDYDIESVPGNTLIIIQNGRVISTRKYDRSGRFQVSYGSKYYAKDYDREDYYGYGSYGYKNTSAVATTSKKNEEEPWFKVGDTKTFEATSIVAGEAEARYDYVNSNKVIFKPDGRYYKGKVLMSGPYRISEYGFENTYSNLGTDVVARPKTFYFFQGFLMKDALCMHIARRIYEMAGDKFKDTMLRKLTMGCFYDPELKKFYTRKGKLFTGTYPVYFTLTNRVYKIQRGEIYQYTESYNPNSCSVWKTYCPQYEGPEVPVKFANLIEKSAKKIMSIYNV